MHTETANNTQCNEQNGERGCACSGPAFRPDADIVECSDGVVISLDVPGARPEDVDVSFDRGVLTVVARVNDRAPANARSVRREYGVGEFRREFRIGETLDASRIDAALDRGVLTLSLPRAEASKPRTIGVRAG